MTEEQLEIRITPQKSLLDDPITAEIRCSTQFYPEWLEATCIIDRAYYQKKFALKCAEDTAAPMKFHLSGFAPLEALSPIYLQNIATIEFRLRDRARVLARVELIMQISKCDDKKFMKTVHALVDD